MESGGGERKLYWGAQRWFPSAPFSSGALLAWVQGCILVPWTVSSLTDGCVVLELVCGPRGSQPFESEEEGEGQVWEVEDG